MAYCEDYPCCGHTSEDPCEVMPYDAPDYYDTTLPGQEHRLCNHEEGECLVDYDDYDEDDLSDDDIADFGDYMNEDAAMEFGLWGSEA